MPPSLEKQRKMKVTEHDSFVENERHQRASQERLKVQIREAFTQYSEKDKFSIKQKDGLQVTEKKFVEMMKSLENKKSDEEEISNYKYFVRRFFMRMR
jgi:hypothetical protein